MPSRLAENLKALKPVHDTPIGVLHPYWARKPLNTLSEIIRTLTKPGDFVVDPFMGSGTTIFSAIANGRNAAGGDINPLSVFLVKATLGLNDKSSEKSAAILEFIERYSKTVLPWFQVNTTEFVERERFAVSGKFEKGEFKLISTESVVKNYQGNRWTGRRVIGSTGNFVKPLPPFKKFLHEPINFDKIDLAANARIAVPAGAKLSHFFTPKNIAAINAAFTMISGDVDPDHQDTLKLLLSSSLPLLRLSDKKASSQWPYWRPREDLTSRNPVLMMRKRAADFLEAIEWTKENLPAIAPTDDTRRFFDGAEKHKALIANLAVQDFATKKSMREKFDLVLTDPPYADQVPYLEYSAMWNEVLQLVLPEDSYKKEIVKSDAKNRLADSADYAKRLEAGFKSCCALVKKGGHVVWFYQDFNLHIWQLLDMAAEQSGMEIVDVIPLSKQRRSMKTVTTPGRTLDGDLLCVFKKTEIRREKKTTSTASLKALLNSRGNRTLFEMYADVIEFGFKNHCFGTFLERHSDVRELIKF